MSNGSFTDNWKETIAALLLKKTGLKQVPSNYRPASNLSYLLKIIEKFAMEQLVDHLSTINQRSSLNSG